MTAYLLRSVLALFAAGLGLAADYPKAYTSSGQIWIQTSATQLPFQATHDGTAKSQPRISPNGELIVYDVRESLGTNLLGPLNIVFLEWSGPEVRRIKEVPMNKLGSVCGYGEIEWIDDDHVGVACEYGPSGEDYLVLNAVTGDVESEFPGLYFSWSPDHHTLAHVGWIIHFASPASQNNCLLFNDKTVYTPGCISEIRATEPARKKFPALAANGKGAAKGDNRTPPPPDSAHYENIHDVSPPLVWSPNGHNLAFVETIYDFDWGTDKKGEEIRQSGNYRRFLAFVSTAGPATGYRLVEEVDRPQIEWLDDSSVKLKSGTGEKRFERAFDLVADPPKRIP